MSSDKNFEQPTAHEHSADKKSPRKKFISELTDEDLYSDEPPLQKISDATVADTSQKISDATVDDTSKKSSDTTVDDTSKKVSDATVDDTSKKISEPRRKTFHSKNFSPHVDDADTDDEADTDEKKSAPKVKRKISHAEISGIIISVVMLGYSLFTEDKPLFFLSTALLIFLLRPLIGGLFGKHNQAVQNALHGFSIALFFGAILFLFM